MTGNEFKDLLLKFSTEKEIEFRKAQADAEEVKAFDVMNWAKGYADAWDIVIDFCNKFYIQE